MVFYFSGTGNSTFVAATVANFLGLKKSFIPEEDVNSMEAPYERVVIIFPVYSWGVPPLVSKFIKDLGPDYWQKVKDGGWPVDCIMTCGDEVAKAPEMIISDFNKVGIDLQSVWSVIMPNNYVLLPGFNVDAKDVEERKLNSCTARILEIVEGLQRGDRRIDVTRGSMPWLKSRIVFPLFKKWGIFPKKWHFTSNCISCGRCAGICPMLNVKMQDGHPMWGSRCCSCLACYHVCPVHAVEYGKETLKKGQYLFPIKKISSQNYHK